MQENRIKRLKIQFFIRKVFVFLLGFMREKGAEREKTEKWRFTFDICKGLWYNMIVVMESISARSVYLYGGTRGIFKEETLE